MNAPGSKRWQWLAVGALVACGLPGVALGAASPDTTLIPRSAIFGNPERAGAQISPDGKYISFLAPREGVMNVWVVERGKPLADARPLTNEKVRPIRIYYWAANSEAVLYSQDKGGDENFLLYAVDVASGTERKLTDFNGVRVLVYGSSWKRPDELVIGINDRDKAFHDPYLLNVRTGQLKRLFDNTEKYDGFVVDEDLKIRFVTRATADGGQQVFKFDDGKATAFDTIGFEDSQTTGPSGLTTDGKTLYWNESRGRNTAALLAIDLASGQKNSHRARRTRGCRRRHQRPGNGRGAGLRRRLPEKRMAGRGPCREGGHRFPQFKPQGSMGGSESNAIQPDLADRQRSHHVTAAGHGL